MDVQQQLVDLLSATQSSQDAPRKQAEEQLQSLYGHQELPTGLFHIACDESVRLEIRQAALLALKALVLAGWSDSFEEHKGQDLFTDETKALLRDQLLDLVTTDQLDRKLKGAASLVVSKIASADFPDQWPDLLSRLLTIIPNATDGQLHGALKVLQELVDNCFNETHFPIVKDQLVQVTYDVAIAEGRKPNLRALACSIFRSCFDILEMLKGVPEAAVERVAGEKLAGWLPFFLNIMKTRLPEHEDAPETEAYSGLVALKLQVVKVLMRIRTAFPSLLSPHSLALFAATWEELSILQSAYHHMYIEGERQSRMEDSDGLPYTLDFLVLEELDFMQACLRAPPVRAELNQQLQSSQGAENSWVTEVMKLVVAYAQITTEDEGLWDFDVNVFLSEETSVTINYTPRTACGELAINLGEWLTHPTIHGLLAYMGTLFSTSSTWKAKEASLYVLNQVLDDLHELEKTIPPQDDTGFVRFVDSAIHQEDHFLRARGYLVAGSLMKISANTLQQLAGPFLNACLQAIPNDSSEVVQVSCIRALKYYLDALTPEVAQPFQAPIISAIATYIETQDLQELADSDDLMFTLVETLRDAIFLNPGVCIRGNGLDVLFTIASHGANNFQLTTLASEAFQDVTEQIARLGGEAYVELCTKVLPSLTGAFDVGNLTEENALCNFAAELLVALVEQGPEPLPPGFVQTTMPKLTRLLLGSTDEDLLQSATRAVKNIVSHDHWQLFEWQDEQGKQGLEVVLLIISRLLSSCNDHAASEVGSLAAEVVEKTGRKVLGRHFDELLQSVAVRLNTAEHASFIQSLTLVFARLSLDHALDVVDFLASQNIEGQNGLQVVLAKWLENSVTFAGYEEIRQNIFALSKLYDLKDPRLAGIQVKGDLIPNPDGRIMTRSRAKSNPYQHTIIPANLKILKVLVAELQSTSGAPLDPAVAADLVEEGSNDDEWEDEPNPFIDLSSGLTKEQLMSFGADDGPTAIRQRDDATQNFLVEFFKRAAQTPGFEEEFQGLTEEERARLQASVQ